MAAQFSIDDAFALEGDDEGAVSDAEPEGWGGKDGHREGGDMTFGPLSFSKPQAHPSPAASASVEHSNLKYQVLPHELIHDVCTPASNPWRSTFCLSSFFLRFRHCSALSVAVVHFPREPCPTPSFLTSACRLAHISRTVL